jgi:hypothetical protein
MGIRVQKILVEIYAINGRNTDYEVSGVVLRQLLCASIVASPP